MDVDSRNGGCAAADGATSNAVISIAMNAAAERTLLMLDNVALRRSGSQTARSGWQTGRR
jgi:hypothetical protein